MNSIYSTEVNILTRVLSMLRQVGYTSAVRTCYVHFSESAIPEQRLLLKNQYRFANIHIYSDVNVYKLMLTSHNVYAAFRMMNI